MQRRFEERAGKWFWPVPRSNSAQNRRNRLVLVPTVAVGVFCWLKLFVGRARMRVRFSLILVFWLVLLVIITSASDASAQDVFVTPIPNVPFSGVINVERSVVQPDGFIASFRTVRDIHRDSQGRIYNEGRALLPVSSTDTPQVVRIHLYDPQTRISTTLIPQQRIFWTDTVNRPPETVPPALLTGSSIPQSEFTKEEDLGNQEVAGVPARGFRETQTIPADKSGTGKEIVITDEYWYSDELRINVMIKHSDPRKGTTTLKVTQITREEPDRALFEIPDGYTAARAVQGANATGTNK